MEEARPEFISLLRTIRDNYYPDMSIWNDEVKKMYNEIKDSIHPDIIEKYGEVTAMYEAMMQTTASAEATAWDGPPDATFDRVSNNTHFKIPGGKPAQSLIAWMGEFTPTIYQEYPETDEYTQFNSAWKVNGVSSHGYIFKTGSLKGTRVDNTDIMLWNGGDSWNAGKPGMNDAMYYRLDGTIPIASHFKAGGYKITDIAEATLDTDAISLSQLIHTNLGDLHDVNITNPLDQDNLTYDGVLGLWKNGEGMPTLGKPWLSEYQITGYQTQSKQVSIVNYEVNTQYSAVSDDTGVATVAVSGDTITVTAKDVTANGNCTIFVGAKKDGFIDSPLSELKVSVIYNAILSESIVNSDFLINLYLVDGFRF